MLKDLFYIKITLILFICLNVIPAESYSLAGNDIKQANMLYEKGQYEEAVDKYEKVLKKMPDSHIVNFDAGTTYYKKKDYLKSAEALNKASLSDDLTIEFMSNYNMGNVLYRQGEPFEKKDVNKAIKFYKEALAYYKRGMEINDEDEDVKFNYEYVKNKIKALQDKEDQKQDQNKQDQKDQKQDQNKQDEKDQKQDQNKQAQKDEQQEQDNKDQEDQKQKQDKKGPEDRNNNMGANNQGKTRENTPKEMTEEQARMLLEGFRQEEEAKGDKVKSVQPGNGSEVLKDW